MERLIVAGDRVVALVEVRVRLKDEVEWREGQVGDVFTFRDGKLIRGKRSGTGGRRWRSPEPGRYPRRRSDDTMELIGHTHSSPYSI